MKKALLSLLASLLVLIASPQTHNTMIDNIRIKLTTFSDTIPIIDSVFKNQLRTDTGGVLSRSVFNKYLDTKFTYLAYQRSTLPTGNSASLDLLDNSTQVKLAIAKKFSDSNDRPIAIATAGVQAKIGDGIANIFNGNVATTGTTLFINFATLDPHGSPKRPIIKRRLAKFLNGKEVPTPFSKLVSTLSDYQSEFSQEYVKEFAQKYNCLLDRLSDLEKMTPANCPDYLEVLKEKETIKKQLKDAGLADTDLSDILDGITKKYEDGYYNLLAAKPAWDWYHLRWLSGGLTYTRNTYVTYDSSRSLGKRFDSKDFDSWGLNLTLNWYHENFEQLGFVRTWYANISYAPQLINSFTGLTAQSISANINAATSADTTIVFQNAKSAIDISGVAYKTTWQHNFSAVYTAMFSKKKNVGINLLAQGQFSSVSKPIFNTRIGLLVALQNNNFDPDDKTSKAKVNFELFVQFPDMADAGGKGGSVWQNRVIGISTNIPFNKIFLQ